MPWGKLTGPEFDLARQLMPEMCLGDVQSDVLAATGVLIAMPRLVSMKAALNRPPREKIEDAPKAPVKRVTVRNLITAACGMTKFTAEQIRGPQRQKPLVNVRFAISYIASRRGFSYPQIGKVMNRDHSTILHGRRQAEYLYAKRPAFKMLVDELEAQARHLAL